MTMRQFTNIEYQCYSKYKRKRKLVHGMKGKNNNNQKVNKKIIITSWENRNVHK